MLHLFTLCFALSLVTGRHIDPPDRDHLRRQFFPGPDTTSINWWPYPAWGASAAPAIPSPTEATPITAVTSLVAAVTGGGADTMQPILIPTPTISSFVSFPDTPTESPTASSSTASLIRITALPPATTRTPRPPSPKNFNIVYLTPLFAVLGIVAGAICTWLFLRWHSRKYGSGRYTDSLQPGPEYSTSSSRTVSVRSYLAPTDISREGAAHRSGRNSLSSITHEGELRDGQAGSWFTRMLSSRRAGVPGSSSVRTKTQRSSTRDIDEEELRAGSDVDEYDPFIEPPLASRGPSAGSTTLADSELARSRSLLTTSFLSPGSFAADENWAEVPYDTLRHKSIRRGILNKLKNGSLYRKGHKRQDSDLHVEDLRVASEGVYSPVAMHDSPARCQSQRSNSSAVPRSTIEEGSVPGFRIIEEDPDAVPSRQGSVHTRDGGWSWSLPWSSGNKSSLEDRLTPLPSRRSTAEKRKTPTPSPTRSRPESSDAISTNVDLIRPAWPPQIDSSVLPSSPALLTSPPMEERLFFGPVSSYTPTSAHHGIRSDGGESQDMSPRVDRQTRKTNKLHTNRSPPLLPFPSSNKDSPYRSRLTKKPGHAKEVDVTSHLSTDSVNAMVDAREADSLDGRHASCHGALNKVDEIIARSWSERELRGDPSTKSPTMFGALPVPERSPLSQQQWNQELERKSGIDERMNRS